MFLNKKRNTFRQDKQDLLRKFVQNQENIKLVETSFTVSREQAGEVEHRRVLLTIREMRERGFSQQLGFKHTHFEKNLQTSFVKDFTVNMFHFCSLSFEPSSNHRRKIDTVIQKQAPVADEDAPDDPESVRFWVTDGSSYTETDKTKVAAKASAQVETTADGLAGLVGPAGDGSEFGSMLGSAPSTAGSNRPTLKSLVDLANAPDEASAAPAAKAKAKAKAKGAAKAKVSPKDAKTPAEQRAAVRSLFDFC